MEVLLGRSHAEKQVLFTWAFGVVPSGLSLSWPDMSQYMRLLSVSDESADSEGSASMAVGLSAYLAEGGRRTRPRQPRTTPLRRGTRGAGCKMQRVRP